MAQPANPISAGGVLRRSLIIWGWGQASLGNRRAWLLAVVQFLAIADLLIIGPQLTDTTLWLLPFVPIVLIAVFWVAQAVRAYRRALALGGAPGGELQLALFLPLLLAVFTAFWLVSGRHGSAASTVEAYMDAWEANRVDLALPLFAGDSSVNAGDIATMWQGQTAWLDTAVESGRTAYGEDSGFDPDRPFRSLRVTQTSATTFSVELVRSERFQTTLLGIIPTAGLRTVVDAPVMTIVVTQEAGAAGPLRTSTWRIEQANPAGAT